MGQEKKPATQQSAEGTEKETAEEREHRFVGREVTAEDEERNSPGGPRSQVAPDVEPSGS